MTAGPVDLRYKFDIDIILYNIWMLPGIVWNCPWFRPIFFLFFLAIQARNNSFLKVCAVYMAVLSRNSWYKILKKDKCKSC